MFKLNQLSLRNQPLSKISFPSVKKTKFLYSTLLKGRKSQFRKFLKINIRIFSKLLRWNKFPPKRRILQWIKNLHQQTSQKMVKALHFTTSRVRQIGILKYLIIITISSTLTRILRRKVHWKIYSSNFNKSLKTSRKFTLQKPQKAICLKQFPIQNHSTCLWKK